MSQQPEIEAALDRQVLFDSPTIRYYYQDGATFFMFKSESAALGGEIGQDEEISTCEYPAGMRSRKFTKDVRIEICEILEA